ncbi:MAG: type I-E CRISPR-associated protein Cas7/Cse4/CasC [Bifidobacteriaceae bacterium]|jgi:CRISPR system Cascade subunit CasC|nr:type I-E CRISPR-associated protein Cas7/Cse4/CasC [Bifidobacteriaceae bacterium]
MIQPRLYADIHIIQSLPPSNVNRDDTGTPKEATYGGTRRGRISSQASKRATRIAFAQRQEDHLRAIRTRRLHEVLSERLVFGAALTRDFADKVSAGLVEGLGIPKIDQKKRQLPYLLFFGLPQLDAAVAQVRELQLDASIPEPALKAALAPVKLEAALSEGHPVDVALFGRMVADLPRMNVDAAVQVAHALSTHPVEIGFDYFTAVDDENPREDTGAGMIGTVEFNSATYYRYASVGVHQLAENLSGSWEAAVAALDLFVDSFALSVPSGHQNSFAHRTRPTLVAVVVRQDQPVNLVTAFESPVMSKQGVLSESVMRLADLYRAERDLWGDEPVGAFSTLNSTAVDEPARAAVEAAFGPSLGFADLRESLRATVSSQG